MATAQTVSSIVGIQLKCLYHGDNCWLDGVDAKSLSDTQRELRKRWFENDLPAHYLMKIDKDELMSLIWFLRGYFKVDAKTTIELLLALKKDEGYGGEAFRELLRKIEQFKSEVQAVIDDLHESGYYDEADALRGMDFDTLMRLPRAKEYEYGIYEGERVTILRESAGRYEIFIPSRQVQVSVPMEKVEKEESSPRERPRLLEARKHFLRQMGVKFEYYPPKPDGKCRWVCLECDPPKYHTNFPAFEKHIREHGYEFPGKLDAQEAPIRHVLKLHIPEVKESEKLYECEKRRNDLIKECAREWMNAIRELVSTYPELREVLDVSGTDFWGVAVPTALYDILDSFELTSSVLAAKTFLEEYGRDAVEVDIIDLNRIIDFLDMKQRQSMAEAALQSDTQLAQSLARDADCWSMVKLVLEEKDTEDILKELRS